MLVTTARAEGLRKLAEFTPGAGKPYQELRTYDFGPERRNVSGLSPYLRYGLLRESEVAEAVLDQHKAAEAQTFLNELLWRTYWKGWMEGRPQVYMVYRRQLSDDLRRFGVTEGYKAAIEGRTGISAFDAWNSELIETGYLHNQARMSYASIWIFTLRLPWTLGAAHFQQHLLDGDPASNTLGWRSIGGLHTPGKHFLAKAEDIASFTKGRFNVKGRLNESALSLTGPAVPMPRLVQLPQAPSSVLGDNYALLVTPDDLSPEIGPVGDLKPKVIFLCGFESVDKSYQFSPRVQEFVAGALKDTEERLAATFGCPVEPLPVGSHQGTLLGQRLVGQEIPHLLYYQPPVGPFQELVANLTSRDVGLKYFPLRRLWDAQLYPHASKGYIQFQKAALPLVVKGKGKLN